MRKRTFFGLGIAAAALAAAAVVATGGSQNGTTYRLVPLASGQLTVAVAATGSIEAVGTVLIGSQLSGQVVELHADFNSNVVKGQIIARLDPDTFAARLRQAEAELAIAHAGLATADASVLRAQADLETAQADLDRYAAQSVGVTARLIESQQALDRTHQLFESRVVSKANLDTAEAAHEQNGADVAAARASERAQQALIRAREATLRIAEAEVQTALAQIQQREAQRDQARIDLDRTFIRAPVDGVVVKRSIDIGQTVAASLQAPELFTIAEDLRQMQVKVSVDEADIGQIRAGMDVAFTVDAFPRRDFNGSVKQIRLAPEVVQNVVTYNVIVTADNGDLALLPGMTANVELIVDERGDIVKIPNTALRFRLENATPRPGSAAAAPTAARHNGPPGQGGRQLLEHVREAVTLTPAQDERVQAFIAENRGVARSLRENGTDRETIREQLDARIQALLASVLTAEQRQAFRAASAGRQAARPATVYILGAGNQPEAISVQLGISDGQFTELVEGPLEVGQQLIVGVDSTEAGSTRRLPRLGF